MDAEFLAHLMCAVNKKAFLPSLRVIKDKYYELFRGKGDQSKRDTEDSGAGSSNV